MASTTTGRWTEAEHSAFEEGLKLFGTNWRRIQTLVPTRTLVQIRTHAQKYFLKHGQQGPGTGHIKGAAALHGGGDDDGDEGMDGEDGAGLDTGERDLTITPLATIRHVAIEPLHAAQPLGFTLKWSPQARHCVIASFGADASGAEGAGSSAASESSEYIKVGDVLLGVSGVSLLNMDPSTVERALASARAAVPGGLLVLHLSDVGIDADLVQEASIQMAGAAAQLLGAPSYVEQSQLFVQRAVFNPALPVGAR